MKNQIEHQLDTLTSELKTIRQAAQNVADCLRNVEQHLASIRMLIDRE